MDDESVAAFLLPPGLISTTGTQKLRRAGQGMIENFQETTQGGQLISVASKVLTYLESLAGIRGPRLPWGPRKRVSVHMRMEAGGRKSSACAPYQRL